MNYKVSQQIFSVVPQHWSSHSPPRFCMEPRVIFHPRPQKREIPRNRLRRAPLHSKPWLRRSLSIRIRWSLKFSPRPHFQTRWPSRNTGCQENKSLAGSTLMQAVDGQSWDPSVKALTEFPSVLENMSKNLTWTSSLGEAYHDQQADVMTAIQTLRAQAKAKGNLQSSAQIKVVQQSPQVIVIQPANPQIVYIPQYNPTIIYGTPYVIPGYVAPVYSTGDVVAARSARLRRGYRGRRDDERRVLRLGLQQLELRLARHSGGLSRRRLLR